MLKSAETVCVGLRIAVKAALSIIVLTSGLMSGEASATNYTFSGSISEIYLSGGSNYAFRVFMPPVPSGCTGGFVYMNTSNDNYQAFASLFFTSRAQMRNVAVFVTVDGSGYCQIIEAWTA